MRIGPFNFGKRPNQADRLRGIEFGGKGMVCENRQGGEAHERSRDC